jgi:hypothetical protein
LITHRELIRGPLLASRRIADCGESGRAESQKDRKAQSPFHSDFLLEEFFPLFTRAMPPQTGSQKKQKGAWPLFTG